MPPKSLPSYEAIDAVLPQTQCTRCGYPCCRDYAQAIAQGNADINQCPPGGDLGIRTLSILTGIAYKPLSPQHGVEGPRMIAQIDESRCIGCTLCIKACPVDAIVGGFKHMHTVLMGACTGCELCLPPCPVDCIAMIPPQSATAWSSADAAQAKARFNAHEKRLQQRIQADAQAGPKAEHLARILAKAKDRAQARLAQRDEKGRE
ncbi:MAG: RnfABCDGE type electron transport complex subunit B [Burkholderiaceae bacterium]|nr:RnfABCDGE type electron transport complex subunit B [Burkholderiaceae bacterium]